jgi:predicted lipoprotein with Yx(FWY)xxD motif
MNAIRITLVAVALCALAACTGESGTPPAADTSTSLSTAPSEATASSSVSASASGSTGTSSVALNTAKVQGLGNVLVGQNGHTVYLFTNDTGSTSTCTGSCASTWPAVITGGQPTVSGSVDDSKIGTNNAGQVTYNGHPLYYYGGDSKAGLANGQGIGGIWFAVTPDGNPAGQADDSGGGTSGNG